MKKQPLENVSIEVLKEALIIMANDLSVPMDAFNLGLDILESKIPEREFIDFCDSM